MSLKTVRVDRPDAPGCVEFADVRRVERLLPSGAVRLELCDVVVLLPPDTGFAVDGIWAGLGAVGSRGAKS